MKAIGVDLGGTKIEAALVDGEGNKLDSVRVPTEADRGWEKILENIKTAINKVEVEDIEGICIGTPGFIHENSLQSTPNVPDLDKALDGLKEERPQLIIENDANCFAIAEHKWGAGKDVDNMVGLIWGTGIGAGIISDGKLLRGAIGGAGEVGHTIIDFRIGNYCEGCPGTWEYLCSGPNIIRRYREEGGDKSIENPSELNDEIGKKILDETLTYMGMGIGNIINTINPELIVMGGGVSNLDVYEQLNEETDNHSIPLSGQACKVVKNELGDSAGVLGAAALVFRNL